MKKMLKSYLVFVPMLCRVILFLLIPVLLIALQIWIAPLDMFYTSSYLMLLILMLVQIILDNWVFGGIATKNVRQPEYLKSSTHGMTLIKHALAADTICGFVESVMVVLIGAGAYVTRVSLPDGKEILAVFTLLFFANALTSLTLLVVRFFDGIMASMMAAFISEIIFGGIFLITPHGAVWLLVAGVLLAVVFGTLGVKVMVRRLEDSYYDERI